MVTSGDQCELHLENGGALRVTAVSAGAAVRGEKIA